MDVTRGTLTSVPGLLATKFSGEWDESLLRDSSNGRFFIDEDPELFRELVNYLREINRMVPPNMFTEPEPPSFDDPKKETRFCRMLVSLLSDHVLPLRIFKFDRSTDKLTRVSDTMNCEVNKEEEKQLYFVLQRRIPAQKRIQSFEVQIAASKCIEFSIGWLEYKLEQFQQIAGSVLFAARKQMWLNIRLGTIVIRGYKQSSVDRRVWVPSGDIRNPIIIRCANRGAEWYIDGKLVAETRDESNDFSSVELQPVVYINGKGSFRFTSIEFEDLKKV
jgi:hypothetical protein